MCSYLQMTEFEVVKARLVFMLERVFEPQLSVYYTPPLLNRVMSYQYLITRHNISDTYGIPT